MRVPTWALGVAVSGIYGLPTQIVARDPDNRAQTRLQVPYLLGVELLQESVKRSRCAALAPCGRPSGGLVLRSVLAPLRCGPARELPGHAFRWRRESRVGVPSPSFGQ